MEPQGLSTAFKWPRAQQALSSLQEIRQAQGGHHHRGHHRGRPPSGYDKATQGRDIAAVMDALKVEKADLVTHDIGNMVGYALAAQFPDRITNWVVIDAPLPGIGPWKKS